MLVCHFPVVHPVEWRGTWILFFELFLSTVIGTSHKISLSLSLSPTKWVSDDSSTYFSIEWRGNGILCGKMLLKARNWFSQTRWKNGLKPGREGSFIALKLVLEPPELNQLRGFKITSTGLQSGCNSLGVPWIQPDLPQGAGEMRSPRAH